MNAPSLQSSYLPHINGLRTLAILGVLFYHLRAPYCPAGYFGVDLFLVISGFLLFRSLFKPGAEANFHYGSYLLKKAWRILPSWFIVALVSCLIAIWILPTYDRIVPALKTARASALFHADFYIDESGDYFNAFTQQNPLLHFWYLSITQQLYLIAPLLIIPLARWCSRRAAMVLLGVLCVLSLAYYVLTTSPTLLPDALRQQLLEATGCKTAYYHLVTRFWEVSAGMAVFLLPEFSKMPWLRSLLGTLGLAGIVTSFYLYETGSPEVYLAVAASLLALRYAGSGPAAWLLGLKPVQALGTISFSLYLWHWPIMVFWKYCSMDAPGPWDEVGMVAVSLALGTLSWWAIESLRTPSRYGWQGTLRRCSLLLLIPLMLVGISKTNKYVRKHSDHVSLSMQIADTRVFPGEEAAESAQLEKLGMPNRPQRMGSPEVAPTFLLIGDSHAQHLQGALHDACLEKGISGIFFGNSAVPFWNLDCPKYLPDPCCWSQGIAEQFLSYLKNTPSIRYVLINELWVDRLIFPNSTDWRTGERIRDDERFQRTAEALANTCDELARIGVNVLLLGDTPRFKEPFPLDEWQRCQKLGREYQERIITQEEHSTYQHKVHQLHERLASEGKACYIDLAPSMLIDGAYPARQNGEFLYWDCHHLSKVGARRAVNYLMPQLLELLNQQPSQP